MNQQERDQVEARFRAAWPNTKPVALERRISFLMHVLSRYTREFLDDPHFIQQIISINPVIFEQRLSELLLAEWLWRHGFTLASPPKGHGPDFLATKGRHTAWIELVSPEPIGIDPKDLSPPQPGTFEVREVPFAARTLRWTSGLQAKQQQLVGHIQAGIVKPGDAYVIAVNARLLDPVWSDINGISRRPVPLEVAFGVGPMAIDFSRATGKAVGSRTTYRANIAKKNGSPVDTHVFLDPAFNRVSAILGVALHDAGAFGRPYPAAAIYNPHAEIRVPTYWLPGQQHWTGKDHGDHWLLRRQHSPGRHGK